MVSSLKHSAGTCNVHTDAHIGEGHDHNYYNHDYCILCVFGVWMWMHSMHHRDATADATVPLPRLMLTTIFLMFSVWITTTLSSTLPNAFVRMRNAEQPSTIVIIVFINIFICLFQNKKNVFRFGLIIFCTLSKQPFRTQMIVENLNDCVLISCERYRFCLDFALLCWCCKFIFFFFVIHEVNNPRISTIWERERIVLIARSSFHEQ